MMRSDRHNSEGRCCKEQALKCTRESTERLRNKIHAEQTQCRRLTRVCDLLNKQIHLHAGLHIHRQAHVNPEAKMRM